MFCNCIRRPRSEVRKYLIQREEDTELDAQFRKLNLARGDTVIKDIKRDGEIYIEFSQLQIKANLGVSQEPRRNFSG